MKVVKNILAVISIVVFGLWFSGCAGKPITFKSVDPKQYEDVKDKGREINASASGFQLLYFIPLGINDRHQSAYGQLMAEANGDYVTDVKIKESWTYGFVGTVYTTTITATAYPKKN